MIINNPNAQHQAIALILLPVRTVCRPLARRGTGLMQGRDPGVSRPRGPKMTGPQPGAPFWDTGSTGSGGIFRPQCDPTMHDSAVINGSTERRGSGIVAQVNARQRDGRLGGGEGTQWQLQHRRRQSRSRGGGEK